MELTTFNTATTSTYFDLNNDGFAEQTAWVNNDDGLLVRDLDSSGTIDSAAELFGSTNVDGFVILATLDSNGDLVIDVNDTAWNTLLVWQDANDNALTDSGELLTLASLNIVSFDLAGVTPSTSTISGNAISHTSTYMLANGTTRAVADAWFVHSTVNTSFTGDYTLDQATLFLPTLRGFGKLPDLHISMSDNQDLLDLVQQFVLDWSWDRLADPAALDADVAAILHEWAGVTNVSPTSRGGTVNGQNLEFLEEYFGEEFLQWGFNPEPWTQAGGELERAWSLVFGNIKAQLIMQVGGADLFGGSITYNPFTGALEGDMDLSQTQIGGLVAFATDTGVNAHDYWMQVAELVRYTKGYLAVTGTEEGWLDTGVDDSGLADTWDDIVVDYEALDDTEGQTFNGTSSGETLVGTAYDDLIYGNGGNDQHLGATATTSSRAPVETIS